MTSWKPIDTAPKDGREVNLRREVNGRLVEQGTGMWGTLDPAAPIRLDDPKWGSQEMWVRPSRQFAFPVPTEWAEIE